MPLAPDAAVLDSLERYLVRLDPQLANVSLDRHAHMIDAGYVDSLRATELLAFVEETYGVDVEADRLLTDLSSLHALATWVAERKRP